MKSEAFFLVKTGRPEVAFEKREFEVSAPEGIDVVVKVEAFGLNFADVVMRHGMYRGAPPLPFIPGYEVVGKVVKLGPNADPNLLNKRVIAFCRFGGYAKHITTQDYATVPIDSQPAGELLALCTQAATAYYMAAYLTNIHKGDRVLIHAAAGGVGSILIQLAKLKGAIVYAKVGSEEKEDLVKSLGADEVINYRKEDYLLKMKELLNGENLDISFNPAAGKSYKQDRSLLGSGGRIIIFGASELSGAKYGIFSKLNFVKNMGLVIPVSLMMTSQSILGVNMLNIADEKPKVLQHCLQEVVKLYLDDKLKPFVGGEYTSDQLLEAHGDLEGGMTRGKLAITW
jgi:NADPH2:quinone reductase